MLLLAVIVATGLATSTIATFHAPLDAYLAGTGSLEAAEAAFAPHAPLSKSSLHDWLVYVGVPPENEDADLDTTYRQFETDGHAGLSLIEVVSEMNRRMGVIDIFDQCSYTEPSHDCFTNDGADWELKCCHGEEGKYEANAFVVKGCAQTMQKKQGRVCCLPVAALPFPIEEGREGEHKCVKHKQAKKAAGQVAAENSAKKAADKVAVKKAADKAAAAKKAADDWAALSPAVQAERKAQAAADRPEWHKYDH